MIRDIVYMPPSPSEVNCQAVIGASSWLAACSSGPRTSVSPGPRRTKEARVYQSIDQEEGGKTRDPEHRLQALRSSRGPRWHILRHPPARPTLFEHASHVRLGRVVPGDQSEFRSIWHCLASLFVSSPVHTSHGTFFCYERLVFRGMGGYWRKERRVNFKGQ